MAIQSPSTESVAKAKFARIFTVSDWPLFKETADLTLEEAAHLKTSSLKRVPAQHQLRIRNIRKRLFIGIGTELLLKAAFLKSGYGINLPPEGTALPYELSAYPAGSLDPNKTINFNAMIDHATRIFGVKSSEGLKIAKVYRNKEGHSVTRFHKFEPADYRAIEASLTEFYANAFGEKLDVRISMKSAEKSRWRLK